MRKPVEIGLPALTEEQLAHLTEECEDEITRYVMSVLPPKSISDLMIVCTIDLDRQLELEVELDIVQEYDTGHSLDDLANQAVEHGAAWLETRLREMKDN